MKIPESPSMNWLPTPPAMLKPKPLRVPRTSGTSTITGPGEGFGRGRIGSNSLVWEAATCMMPGGAARHSSSWGGFEGTVPSVVVAVVIALLELQSEAKLES